MTEYEKQSLELLKLICTKLDDIKNVSKENAKDFKEIVVVLNKELALEVDKTDY